MEQFSLDKWLQDKSRKLVTKDGRPVRVICTDRKANSGNIVGLVGEDESLIYVWNSNGIHIVSCIEENDLFFADEEEELTEFEKQLGVYIYFPKLSSQFDYDEKNYIRNAASVLLNLARKELMSEISDFEIYDKGFKEGKKYALKDSPKWKKDNNNLSSLTYRLDNRGGGNILLCRKGYSINIRELLNLPTEN